MKKSSSQGRKKVARKLNKEEQVPLRPRRKGVMVNSILWSVFFVVIMSFFLTQTGLLEGGPKTYTLGSIADSDVRAPRDIQYEDLEATRLKRIETGKNIKPVFDLDPSVTEQFSSGLSRVFASGRSLVEETLAETAGGSPSQAQHSRGTAGRKRSGGTQPLIGSLDRDEAIARFRPLFAPLKPFEPSADELVVMIRLRFAHALEQALIESGMRLLSNGYAGEASGADPSLSAGIVMRNIKSGAESESGPREVFRSFAEARKVILGALSTRLDAPDKDLDIMAGFVVRLLKPNVFYNRILTLRRREEAQETAGHIMVKIPKGKIIVRYGDEITRDKLLALRALREEPTQGHANFLVFFGTVVMLSCLVFVQWRFIREHPRFERIHRSCHVLTIIIMAISLFAAKLYYVLGTAIQESMPNVSWADPVAFKLGAPLVVGAMLVVLLLDVQVGYLFAILFSLLLGYLVDGDAFLMFYAFIGNIAAIYGLNMSAQKQRGALWKAGGVVAVANCLVIMGHALRTTPFPPYPSLLGQLAFGLLGPLVLTFPIVFVAMYLLETIFGITTDIRLLELSNTNEPLLKQLQIQAPGTFHHSLMVANLAEPAAEAVNAHALYVRVASLYHDVGKINKPEYFIENQDPGINRHDKLTSSMSSLILISHVKDGLELAKHYKLPQGIRDVIRQHHGTRLIKYFYSKAKESANPDLGNVNESDYRYPGPRPQTREAAIIMLADALEAASRTLTDPSPAKLQGLVRKIVQDVFADQQLDDCDLTLRELEKISNTFLRVLAAVHHQRIDYPGFRFENQEDFKKARSSSAVGKVLDWKQDSRKRALDGQEP